MLKIDFLKNHPQHLKTVVDWVYNEWWKYRSGYSFKEVYKIYSELLNDKNLPIALIALKDNIPVGTALICEYDPDIKIKVTPWLEGLFVKENYRKQGIGAALVMHVEEIARSLSYEHLYLSTHIDRWYSSMGWTKVKHLWNNDSLMRFSLENETADFNGTEEDPSLKKAVKDLL